MPWSWGPQGSALANSIFAIQCFNFPNDNFSSYTELRTTVRCRRRSVLIVISKAVRNSHQAQHVTFPLKRPADNLIVFGWRLLRRFKLNNVSKPTANPSSKLWWWSSSRLWNVALLEHLKLLSTAQNFIENCRCRSTKTFGTSQNAVLESTKVCGTTQTAVLESTKTCGTSKNAVLESTKTCGTSKNAVWKVPRYVARPKLLFGKYQDTWHF